MIDVLEKASKAALAVLGASVAVASLGGCAAEVVPADEMPEVEAAEAALLGSYRTAGRGCRSERQAVLRQASLIGRTIASSDAFAQCVTQAVSQGVPLDERDAAQTSGVLQAGPYLACEDDPLAGLPRSAVDDYLIAVGRSPNEMEIRCKTMSLLGKVTPENQHDLLHDHRETMVIGTSGIDAAGALMRTTLPGETPLAALQRKVIGTGNTTQGLSDVANTIWHEAVHTHGFKDRPFTEEDGQCPLAATSATYIVGNCIDILAQQATTVCNQQQCSLGHTIAVPDGFGSGTCECVRDPSTFVDTSETEWPSPILDPNEAGDLMGFVTARGDFNGDGFDDLAVGSHGEDSNTGAVYVYHGTVFGLYPRIKLGVGEATHSSRVLTYGDLYGAALAAGDFDGDGFEDLAVGVPGRFSGQGRVFIHRGGVSGLHNMNRTTQLSQSGLGSNEAGDNFGFALAAGRVDGDVFADLVVGAPNETPGAGVRSGYAFLFRGSVDGLSAWMGLHQGSQPAGVGDLFGAVVAIGEVGPANGGDVVIGAPGDRGTGGVFYYANRGELGAGSTAWPHERWIGEPYGRVGSGFGTSIAIGRFTRNANNGHIAIGAPLTDFNGWTDRGAVYVYDEFGWVRHFATRSATREVQTGRGPAHHEQFGLRLATVHAEHQTAFDDLLVTSGSATVQGEVTMLIGRTSGMLEWLPDLELRDWHGGTSMDRYASAIAVGDFNGDGYDDVVVGANGRRDPGSAGRHGRVYMYQGTGIIPSGPHPWAFTNWKSFTQQD